MKARDSRLLRALLLLFFLLAILYTGFESRGFLFGPEIHLEKESFSSSESFVSVKGRAERISELRLNGNPISVTESGEFNEPYLLAPGSNRIILEASDARGRTDVKTLDIVYIASPEASSTRSSASSTLPVATSSPSTTSPVRPL